MPVIEWLKGQYGIDYVDMITEPGPERILAEGKDRTSLESIYRCLEISITRHNSNLVAVVGHHDCAGNPGDEETQLEHIITAIKTVKFWGFKIPVIGLRVDENWKVQRVNPTKSNNQVLSDSSLK